jgi:hypothetical protein
MFIAGPHSVFKLKNTISGLSQLIISETDWVSGPHLKPAT